MPLKREGFVRLALLRLGVFNDGICAFHFASLRQVFEPLPACGLEIESSRPASPFDVFRALLCGFPEWRFDQIAHGNAGEPSRESLVHGSGGSVNVEKFLDPEFLYKVQQASVIGTHLISAMAVVAHCETTAHIEESLAE